MLGYMTPISICTFIEMLFPKHTLPGSSIVILLDITGRIERTRDSGKKKKRHKIERGGKEKEENENIGKGKKEERGRE